MNKEIKLNKILSKILDDERLIIENRRHIHQNPELSFKEFNTMRYVCSQLDEIGVSYTQGIAETGILVCINGEKQTESPKTLLIRADMDALPICEVSDKPYRSINDGIMHACGHDAHTAILIEVCRVLNAFKADFSGTVKLVFQPGEETRGGAKPMIDSGVLKNPDTDACIALHMDPDIPSGKIRVKPGSLYASPDDFYITVIGRGGHGAEPHRCIDPIAVSAEIINALMNIVSREIDPFDEAVVSVGSIHSGTATNIIPDTAEISGTARSLTNEVRAQLKKRIGETAQGICAAHGAKCEYSFSELFPPLINDRELSERLYRVACRIIGEENCIFGGRATMAGEDFSYFSQERPSVLFKLGCRNEELGIIAPIHHNKFDIDESTMKYGAAVFCEFAVDFLNR